MARQTFAEWLHNRFGITLKQCAESLKEVLPGLGETVTEDELALTDVTTANSSTTKHGFLKKLSNVATEVLDGQGAWRSIATILGYTPMDAAAGAGGVLSGSYPNPGFAVNMATQAELDAVATAKEDVANKSTDIDADTGSNAKYPSVSAVEAYVDANAGGGAGAPQWIGPWTIYARKYQSAVLTADGGSVELHYGAGSTNGIPWNANAAAVQAELEAEVPGLAGKVVCAGGPWPAAITFVFDDSVGDPALLVADVTLLVDDVNPGTATITITDLPDSVFSKQLYTPAVGDIIVDYMLQRVEAFGVSAAFSLGDAEGPNEDWYAPSSDDLSLQAVDSIDAHATFSGGNVQDPANIASASSPRSSGGISRLPSVCKVSTPLFGIVYDAGGPENFGGIVKVWLCVATPVAP